MKIKDFRKFNQYKILMKDLLQQELSIIVITVNIWKIEKLIIGKFLVLSV